jgi:hypothetical protein
VFKISVSRCRYQRVRDERKDSFGAQITPSWAVDVQHAVRTRNWFLTHSESPSITLSEIRSLFLLLAARQPFKIGLFVSQNYPFTQDGPLHTDSDYRLFRARQEARVRSEDKARQGTRRQGRAAPYRRGRLTLDLIKKPRSRVRKGKTQATSRDLYIQDGLYLVISWVTLSGLIYLVITWVTLSRQKSVSPTTPSTSGPAARRGNEAQLGTSGRRPEISYVRCFPKAQLENSGRRIFLSYVRCFPKAQLENSGHGYFCPTSAVSQSGFVPSPCGWFGNRCGCGRDRYPPGERSPGYNEIYQPGERNPVGWQSPLIPTATIAYLEKGKKQEYGRRTRQDKAREDKEARRPIEKED